MRLDKNGNEVPSTYGEYLSFCIIKYGENSGAADFVRSRIKNSTVSVGGEKEGIITDHEEMLAGFDFENKRKNLEV